MGESADSNGLDGRGTPVAVRRGPPGTTVARPPPPAVKAALAGSVSKEGALSAASIRSHVSTRPGGRAVDRAVLFIHLTEGGRG